MKTNKQLLIGYYKASVILTYLAVISGIIGINFALKSESKIALVFIIISGLCDAFDGKIARKCKRTKQEKEFGIQLDSLADMVSFIFLPIALLIGLKLDSAVNIFIYIIYTLCGIIRLAYFNIIADENNPVKNYTGLPVTSAAIIFPIIYMATLITTTKQFNIVYTITMFLAAILFVLNFSIKKPTTKQLYLLLFSGILLICIFLIAI